MNEHFTEKSRQQPGGTTQQCTHAHKQARAHDERTHILLRAHNFERERYPSTPTHGGECESSNHRESNAQAHKAVREPEDFITCKQSCVRGEREREARAGGAALRDSAGHGQSRDISARRENYSRGVLQVVMLSTVMSRCPRHTKQHTHPHAHMIKYNISLSHPLPREEYTLPPPKRRRAETCSRLSPPLHTSPNPHKMSPYALSQNAASAPPSLSIL